MATNVFPARFIDARVDAYFTAGLLNNKTGGMWEKFASSGKDSVTGGDSFTIAKPGDVELSDAAAHRSLFDRTSQGVAYARAMEKRAPASNAIGAKRESDMLASMLQAFGVRYAPRLRCACATMSRCASIARGDSDRIQLGVSKA